MVHDVGLSNIPNRCLLEAKYQKHELNLMLIGPAGCGKSTLINSLCCREVLSPIRQRFPGGFDVCAMKEYSTAWSEGGVELELSLTEVLGYGEAQGEAFKALLEHVVHVLRLPLEEQLRKEYAKMIKPFAVQTKTFHAVLFFLNPANPSISTKDKELLVAVKDLAVVIPIITKADCYTEEELRERKYQVRRALDSLDIPSMPFRGDSYYQEFIERMETAFPLAIVGSSLAEASSDGTKRVRTYPWGRVDIDDEAISDLTLLQDLLFRYRSALQEMY